MRQNLDPYEEKLCNCCVIKEQRNKKWEENMKDEISLLIKVPLKISIEIEEKCIVEGVSLSQYFLRLHNESQAKSNFCSSDNVHNDDNDNDNVCLDSDRTESDDEDDFQPRKRGRPRK